MTWSSIELGSAATPGAEPADASDWAPADLGDVVARPPAGEPALPDPAALARDAEAEAAALAELHEAELKTAYERGRAHGRQEGRSAEAERLAEAVLAAERAIDALRAAESERAAAVESNVAALAVAVAQHVIGREVETGAEIIADLVRRALTHFPVSQPVRIRINPQDLSLISAVAPDGQDAIPIAPGREVRWLADPAILRGGCMVEGQDRVVDGRVDLALERAFRALTDG